MSAFIWTKQTMKLNIIILNNFNFKYFFCDIKIRKHFEMRRIIHHMCETSFYNVRCMFYSMSEVLGMCGDVIMQSLASHAKACFYIIFLNMLCFF